MKELKKPYILGKQPYKRYIKGPCAIGEIEYGRALVGFADANSVIDTKGIKNREEIIVIPGAIPRMQYLDDMCVGCYHELTGELVY